MSYQPGQRIKFAEEKQSYKIIAANDRFLICTKPFNAIKSFLYTIVDLQDKRRGPDNMIFGPQFDYNKPAQAEKALKILTRTAKQGIYECNRDDLSISHRRDCELNIDWVK